MASETGGTYLPPVIASLIGDSDSLARTLIDAKALLEEFAKTDTVVDIRADMTSLAQLQFQLSKDLGGLQAMAEMHPVGIPLQLELFNVLNDTARARAEIEDVLNNPTIQAHLDGNNIRLVETINAARVLLADFAKTDTTVDIAARITALVASLAEAKTMLGDFVKTDAAVDITARITPLERLQADLFRDIGGIQALAELHPIDIPMQLDIFKIISDTTHARLEIEEILNNPAITAQVGLTPVTMLQAELFKDIAELQSLAELHPIDIPLQMDMFKIVSDTTHVRMAIEEILSKPVTAKVDLTPLSVLQLELFKDIGGIQALAHAHPVDIPMQLDMFKIISDTTMARVAILETLNHPEIKADIGPHIDMAGFITARLIISSIFAGIFAGLGGIGGLGGALGFGKGAGIGGGGWMPQILPAGLPFLAGFGTIGGLAGFSIEHVLTVILGLAGSLSEAFAGLGVIALGAFASMAVGMGSDMAVMKSTIADTQTLYKAWTGVQQAVLLYGANSTQAQAATQNLNNQLKILGNTAGVQAELGLAKLAYTINQQWDKATSAARVQAVGLLTQILLLGRTYIPLVAEAARENLTIINQGIKPLFTWLEGPTGIGIFKHLEAVFRADLPTAIDTFNKAIEFLLRFLDLASNYTGGFMQTLDRLFTYLNSAGGFARVTKDVQTVVGVFKIWRDFIIILGKDLFILLGQTVGVGNSIIVSLTGMLNKLHDWLESTSGKSAIGSLFAAHKAEILALLGLLPLLVGPVASLYLKLAVPLTNIAVAILNIVNGLLALPGAGPVLAYAAAFWILASRMGLVTGLLAAYRGIVAIATAATVAFDIAIDANVIALVVIGIIALIAIIVLLITHWKDVTNVVQAVWKNVTHWVGQIVADVGKFFSGLGTMVEKTWAHFAARPGYWIGYAISFAVVKLLQWALDFDKFFAGIIVKVGTWGINMAKGAPSALAQFILAVMKELKKLPDQVFSVGSSIATGIWKGLQSMQGWLLQQLEGFLQGLVAGALKALGSHSPSTKFAMVGETIPQGIALGVNRMSATALAALSSMFNQMSAHGQMLSRGNFGGSSLAFVGGGGSRGPLSINAPITVNVSGASSATAQGVGSAVQKAVHDEFDRLIQSLQGGAYSTPGG